LPGYDASLWSGLLAPRGTPSAIIARIHAEVTKLLQSKDVHEAYERVGTYVVSTDPNSFGEYIEREFAKWRTVARAINLQIN
jgi:tripartite-type tricarboxylate transporter receptor subunit TctC